ncbi:membrane-bound PQQ-dependent dehydrogenase, glucose/quinate/shikimate family [Pseudomonas sp. 5Ae-yellow]|uniref:membrane-bound PQQ-dependent dehydrogenase, glucose/quinate/shikimate family n=1 Tax=Pseudomonas sp. 5Ae-yellow TaxID=2759848 RepID=UPI0015F371FB|nr:membrane-bound PQQ-dependent dehydrogenase, glucose/quinate/shikimate family [Pseudomonas sp. 5Ae-yellow]MBA6421474.1 membrane-bound PQQ-dependent dehydrogenase, glucose/quinate/shikimate family [Pseudomonas sp. 5Ae-yellow]|tara:strand:- start:3011 stop:5527 length:2517 start_codon:yes stop_codon:yes gene_type:complete
MLRVLIALLILLCALACVVGGTWLGVLGGSWFYLVLGLLLAAAGLLLLAKRAVGLMVYAVALLATLAWSVWEVGFDWWALTPRGGLLFGLGVLLLIPAVRRSMRYKTSQIAYTGMLSLSLLVSAGVAGYALTQTQGIQGAFSEERMTAPVSEQVAADAVPEGEWHAYGRTAAGQRFSPLAQITPNNLGELQEVWRYHTGQIRDGADPGETTYEVTPLVVDDRMYLCTPYGTVITLDPTTGEELWRFDPQLKQPPTVTTQHMTCRGVSYHDAGPAAEQAQAVNNNGMDNAARLQMSASEVTDKAAGVAQNVAAGQAMSGDANPQVKRDVGYAGGAVGICRKRLFVPTSDGRLIAISAEDGSICPGFGGDDGTVNLWANMPNVTPGSYYSTSPPVVTDKVIIVGGAVNDNASTTSPSGVIRAFDIYTGDLVWNFDSKNPDSTAPIAEGDTYSENAPNSWSVSSYDPELDIVYLPMGNQSPDQFGGNRNDAVEKYSSSILALNASTGKVEWVFQTVHHDLWDYDVPAQPSLVDLNIQGQRIPALVAPTKQGEIYVLNRVTGEPVLPVTEVPVPQGAAEGDFTAPTQPVSAISFNPPTLTGKDMWGATMFDQLACRIQFQQLRYEGRYTPPSEQGTLVYPGNFGTFNWGAVAIDPDRQIMFAMPVYLAFTSKLTPRDDGTSRIVTKEGEPIINENFGAPYATTMGPFTSPVGLPCQAPAWGYVAGVDLTTGETRYQRVNGTVRDLAPVPLPFEMGVPGIGGPIVTRGGVAFLSGTLDYYVRGYDLRTGEERWKSRLPAGGQATPSTYLGADGRQYLVVVAGGHGSTGTKAGDAVIAYALPKE